MPTPAIALLVHRLGRLRARVRRLTLVSGLAHVAAWAAAVGLIWFLADRFLDLPREVRAFVRFGLLDRPAGWTAPLWGLSLLATTIGFLFAAKRRGPWAGLLAFLTAGVPGLLGWILLRRLLRPLRVPLSDETLALTVEGRFRQLKDRVAAALDFDRELASPTRGESPAMMAHVIEEASREAEGLEFTTVASGRRALRTAGIALACAGAFAATLLAMPESAALWARRSLGLEEVSWPRATTLVAVVRDAEGVETEKDPATPYTAALGQSLTVLARARGAVPDEVEILDRVAAEGAAGRPLARPMRPVAGEEGLFEHEFRDVRGDFTFTLRGGDDRDALPAWTVVVRVPPRVTDLRCDLAFPAYLGTPPRRVDGGNVTVPDGTRVEVSFASDAPVARAEALVDDAPVALERDGDRFRFTLEATKSVRYRLRIVTPDGRENDAASDTYDVGVEPDTPPRPEWIWPRAPVETTVRGRVPLFAQTSDDHGIASLRLEVLAAGAQEPLVVDLGERTPERADGANDRPYGAQSLLSYLAVEMPSLVGASEQPLVAPTRVQARLVATDSKGQVGAGPWTAVDVLRPDELERGLAGLRTRAKAEFEAMRTEARALRALAGGLEVPATGAGEAERQALRDVQFRQGKLLADATRAARSVGAVFTTFVYARLGADVPTERILGLLERRHRATFSRATDLRGAGAPGASNPGSEDPAEVFSWDAFREISAARRDRLVFDTGVLDKMITALERAVEVADPLAPAAAEAATIAARGGRATELAALLAAQDGLLAGLDSALSAMAEWQSLSELTLFLRRLIEEQEALDRSIHDLKKGSR